MQWSVESSRRKTDISAPPSENSRPESTTLRFGQGPAAQQYLLPVDQPLNWQPAAAQAGFETHIDIFELAAGELLVPSLVLPSTQHYCYSCSLAAGEDEWCLPPVCSDPTLRSQSKTPEHKTPEAVSTHIDLFAIKTALPKAQLRIQLRAKNSPEDYLLVLSRRPHLNNSSLNSAVLSPGSQPLAIDRPEHQVPALSQMTQPSTQRNGTCSPTALSMVMAYYGAPYQPATVDMCKDPATGMYGVWPLNIVQAGSRGFTGAVELISNWSDIAHYPGPFIASISFAKGGLEGAPLEKTGGHLVVVCGTSRDKVLCNDPAAPTAATVKREYDFEQFSRAWLGSRGATYLINPLESDKYSVGTRVTSA